MTFHNAWRYADVVYSEMFEGTPQVVNWSPWEELAIDYTQKYGLLKGFAPAIEQLYVTKLMRRAFQRITQIAGEERKFDFLNETYGYPVDNSKFLIYSAHDTNVGLMIDFLAPHFNVSDFGFASSIQMELIADSSCLARSLNSKLCYFVRTRFNGMHVDLERGKLFEGQKELPVISPKNSDSKRELEIEANNHKLYDMTYYDFVQKMKGLLTHGYLTELCARDWTPEARAKLFLQLK